MSGGRSELGRKLRWLLAAWAGERHWLPLLLGLTVLSAGVTLAYPLVFGHVLERLRTLAAQSAPADLSDQIQRLIALLLGVGLVRMVASTYPGVRGVLNVRLEARLRARYFGALLRRGPEFFARMRTGDLVTRLTDDIAGHPKVSWFLCSGIFRALDAAARVLACLGAMVWLDARLAAWTLLPAPAVITVFLLLQRRLARSTAAQRAAASATSDLLAAVLGGVGLVQARDAEGRMGDLLAAQLRRRAEAEEELARLGVLLSVFFQALNVVGQLAVVVVGGLRVVDGTLELGTFFSFYLFLGLLLAPMIDLPNLFVTGRQAFVCVERLEELVDVAPARAAPPERPGERVEELALEGVSFAHPGRPPLLDGLELRLRRGERVALLGTVGSGKTTLLRLIGGALRPQRGEVTLNGRSPEEWSRERLGERVGYASQDPVLFAASVRENVLLGRPERPEQLQRVLEVAGLSEELAELPGGLDHRLGQRGRGLSGGQRQRLALARALYAEPDLLLLDDVTAALDADNEEGLWERLLAARPDAAILVATHRPATARRMQRVLALRGGQLAPEPGRAAPASS